MVRFNRLPVKLAGILRGAILGVLLGVFPIAWPRAALAEDVPFPLIGCGAPLGQGKTVEMRDAGGVLVARIAGEGAAKNVVRDKQGERRGWVIFKGDRCEVYNQKGRIMYRGRWR